MKQNWDTITADRCKMVELIPNICEGCRDYAYCYRQMNLFESEQINERDIKRKNRKYGQNRNN